MPGVPDISVIVTSHNVADWIGECLSSILIGQETDIEVIVVDDHSTDATWTIASAFAAEDSRIKLVRAIGHSGGQARNYGVELAQAPYIAFCDGDDLVPPRAYEIMLRSARDGQPDMVVGNFLKFSAMRTWRPMYQWGAFGEPRTGVGVADVPALIRNRACWNRLFRRNFWLEHRFCFPSVPRSNDIVPMTKALLEAERINIVHDIIYLYRERPGDTSMTAMASRTANLLSYLSQEHICAGLVQAAGESQLSDVYWDMFLKADGWFHLYRFLQLFDPKAEPGPLRELAALLRAFIEMAPERQWNGAPPERQCLFALCAMAEFAKASDLFRALQPDPPPDTSALVRHWMESASILRRDVLVSEQALRRVVQEHILKPLLRGAGAQVDLETVEYLCRCAPELTTLVDRGTASLREQRLLSALRSADPRRVLTVGQHQQVLALSLKVDGRVARMVGECPAGVAPDACTLLIVRAEDAAYVTEVGAARPAPHDSTRWFFDLEKGAIPTDGGWLVSLQFRDDLGMERVPVLIDPSRITVSAKPWHPLSVTPIDANGAVHLAVFKRRSLIVRGAGKIVQEVRRLCTGFKRGASGELS